MSKHLLCETLVGARFLKREQMAAVLDRCALSEAYPQTVIAELGIATEAQTTAALSAALKLHAIDLRGAPRDPDALALLDGTYCRRQAVLPLALRDDGRTLWLAMADPTNQETIAMAKDRTGKRIHPLLAQPRQLLAAVATDYTAPVVAQANALTREDRVRLGQLQASMQKTAQVLGTLTSLLEEKGVVVTSELTPRRKKTPHEP